jgi:hypothetical protein
VQRKTTPPALSIVPWTQTRRPNHGCHRYKSSRKPVPWVFSNLVVQSRSYSSRSRQGRPSKSPSAGHWISRNYPSAGRPASQIRPDGLIGRDR